MDQGEVSKVFVGGLLLGSFRQGEAGPRNLLLLALTQDSRVHLGRLAEAFEVSSETVRLIRRCYENDGLEAVWKRQHGGSRAKVTPARQGRIEGLFDQGAGVREVQKRLGGRYKISRRTVERLRTEWLASRGPTIEASAEPMPNVPGEPTQLSLPASAQEAAAAGDSGSTQKEEDEGDVLVDPIEASPPIDSAPLCSAPLVQHAGAWLLVAMVHTLGLYKEAFRISAGVVRQGPLRIALDAAVMALGIGQRCMEGVRRLCTPSAQLLLRAQKVPSASWVRSTLGLFSQKLRGAALHVSMAGAYLRRAAAEAGKEPVVFYIDNHLRPYTGKHVVRKGWRMQDKRAVPGCSDYYVHDEDGRPVLRISVPSHGALTDWLSPIARRLREALGPEQRILLCFDRAGAHPEQMAALREEGFEFVTYERSPYPQLLRSAYGKSIEINGERVQLAEPARKNLGRVRGRVRRISVLKEDGKQVNLLAISSQPADWLLQVMVGRWCQENGFKHAGERWGQNQLDGRTVGPYPQEAIIPNPARRRLDQALRIIRAREGQARSALFRLGAHDPRRPQIERELAEALDQQEQLEALRPSVPTHAPLCDTELSHVLVRHREEYKLTLDTVRIACANAETELAAILGPLLPKATEAKKSLANLFAAPGKVRVTDQDITITLLPAGTDAERNAFSLLLDAITARRLTLPGNSRPLRFRIPT